jgi:F-type H+-transporting ATPase subunit b
VELNWTTFILEIINFLVLVWILKRFLYKPVLGIIARRREGIEKAMADAESLNDQAHDLQSQYENRLAEWEGEKQQAREELTREIDGERQRRMQELETKLQQEREKAAEAEARRREEAQRKAEEMALNQAAGFAARLLKELSGPELEARLLTLLLEQLPQMDKAQAARLRQSQGQSGGGEVEVCSAHPLGDEQRQSLEQALGKLLGATPSVGYKQEESLLAGVRITIGSWVLGANLEDELKGFAELGHGAD